MLTPHDAMRLLEDGGVSGLVRYNWSEALTKSMQAAYAAGAKTGAKDMQERNAALTSALNAMLTQFGMDEDEWTDRNFGNSLLIEEEENENTSEDSVSDLDSEAGDSDDERFVPLYFYP